jgi:DeoR/GlpR family transcriptional regulator of sugar metabolism
VGGIEHVEQPLPAERHRRILELLRARQVVRVSALSELLGVSEVTIRRDLEAMERKGLLERTHGGAVRAQHMRIEPAYPEAAATHPEEKRLIGETAARLVEPGDTIFLNGGTTTLQVFRHLDVSGVRVITNHLGIAVEAAARNVDLLLVGGRYRPASNSFVGPFATETLRRLFATKCFIGVEGISLRFGLTTPTPAEAEIARLMMERTKGTVTVVADHSKIGTVADVVIAPLEDVDRLVVDAGVDREVGERLAELGVEVVIAGEEARLTSGAEGDGQGGLRA